MKTGTTLQNLRWRRMFGDTIFAVGALGVGWFVPGLKTDRSFADESEESAAWAAAAKKAAVEP